MKYSALLLFLSASPAFSFDLQSVDVSGIKSMEPAVGSAAG